MDKDIITNILDTTINYYDIVTTSKLSRYNTFVKKSKNKIILIEPLSYYLGFKIWKFAKIIQSTYEFQNLSDVKNEKEFLIVPAFMILIFLQINSAMTNIDCNEKAIYTQVGFSFVVIGLVLVKYAIFDLINLDNKIKLILSYIKNDEFFSDELSASNL
jgi:hypothetical protein